MEPKQNNSGANDRTSTPDTNETTKPWKPMKLSYAGEAKDIVRSGGGKTIVSDADPGDTLKPKGQN